MRDTKAIKRCIILFGVLLIAGGILLACGGGGSDTATSDGRKQALGAGLGSVITWTPASITDAANPGSRQNIPITITASANVSNVAILVVPALQKLVSVTPTSFASLQKGQVATVTLSIAPSATAALGTVHGTVQTRYGGSTLASPLTVTLTLVGPEVINGITVPPEPPADLNNATLAGFDANGNGVRDDVERKLASLSQSPSIYQELFSFARAEQSLITQRTATIRDSYMNVIACTLDRRVITSDDLDKVTYFDINTRERGNAYSRTLAGAIGRDCQ